MDIVLTDVLTLGSMDGYGLARWLRQHHQSQLTRLSLVMHNEHPCRHRSGFPKLQIVTATLFRRRSFTDPDQ